MYDIEVPNWIYSHK